MNWNWQKETWPHFEFDLAATSSLEKAFLLRSGTFLGAVAHLPEGDKDQIRVQLLSNEAYLTSRIEGEVLDRQSLQSSLQRQLGLKADSRKVSPAEKGVSEMLIDSHRSFEEPLTKARLLEWHGLLMQGRRDIEVGKFRSGADPMQIISGAIYDPKIHYEAPPSSLVPQEMERFLKWWHGAGNKLPCLAKASVAHLYFESIHPFEDGNGRIGRTLSEFAVSQAVGHPVILALSQVIDSDKKSYYENLARSSQTLQIGSWIKYFSKTVLDAHEISLRSVEFLVGKARFFDRHGAKLNKRQEKALLRVFREGINGFEGGLSSSNYRAITKASLATATRDLVGLVEIGAMQKTGELKHTRYHLVLKA